MFGTSDGDAQVVHDDDANSKRERDRALTATRQMRIALEWLKRLIGLVLSPSFSAIPLIITGAAFLARGVPLSLRSRVSTACSFYFSVLRPILCCVSVCLGAHFPILSSRSHGGEKVREGSGPWHERVISGAFVLSIASNQFPKVLSIFLSAFAVFAFGLASRNVTVASDESTIPGGRVNDATFQKKGVIPADESRCAENTFQKKWRRANMKERASVGTFAVVVSLLTENFIIWVVSATYRPGIEGFPEPLQDNGRLVLDYLINRILMQGVGFEIDSKTMVQRLRDALSVQWALVSALGATFVCLELRLGESPGGGVSVPRGMSAAGHRRTLAGVTLRALITLALARLIRTISFVLTVLPSQIPMCYQRHFPYPPPAEWKNWIMVGFLPNSRGGCNDLILSGHATVTSTLACASTSVASNSRFSVGLWTLVALDYSIEAYQGLHYSVDMWLGAVVTCLLWQLTSPLEGKGVNEDTSGDATTASKSYSSIQRTNQLTSSTMSLTVVATYAFPAFLGFGVLVVVPVSIVNYFLVGYAIWAGVIFVTHGQTNFSQHLLLCLLFVTLGIYL